ncbi:transcription termination/antitermination protein NusG [Pikeienuella sp. HZG-20]|uniref:transcription termination/antitermination protein NusG n=1 Tax=Paludibacillus litoralis TaxID=3133267 RepID=UPI0030EBF7AE
MRDGEMTGFGRMVRVVDVSRGARPTPGAERRAPAAPCRLDELAARLDGSRWFIARVMGGQEFRVVDRLDQRGIFAFTPTRAVWRRWSRYQARKSLRVFPAAPGYVVFGQPAAFRLQRWVAVLDCDGVFDVLGVEEAGAPVSVSARDVERIARLSTEAREVERFMRARAEFGVGDTVRVSAGAFEGLTSAVLEIEGARARIMAEIFGAAREVMVGLGDLERAG